MLLASFVPLVLFAWAASTTAPRLEATRASQAPRVDGRLDDGVWAQARPSTQFTQKYPDEGAAPSEPTEIRVLYDDDALYIGVSCVQKRSPLALQLSRRDREIQADQVSLSISSRHDGRTAFRFAVTASGVQSDGMFFDDNRYSRTWDETWDAEVARTADGWSTELRIPLRILRFDSLPIQDWGLNVQRFISARQETAEWSFSPRADAGAVSRFGRLDNLVGLRPSGGLELRPFVLAEGQRMDVGFGPRSGSHSRFSAGLDAKAHPSQNLTIDATLNPDFGQVEADEVVLNLTNIETYFLEKRPFFQEGNDVFTTLRKIFYTRRIGAVAGNPALPAGELATSRMLPTPIYGAMKITGRMGPSLAVGALSAVTGPQSLTTDPGDGSSIARTAQPLTFWNVLRLRQDYGDGHVGFFGTAVNRHETPTDYPRSEGPMTLCPAGQEVATGSRCFRDSYVGGFDARWRSPDRDYVVGAQAVASFIHNGPDRTHRDGTVVGSGAAAPLTALTAEKEGGNVLAGLWALYTGRKADTNDLGFMERQNEWRVWTHLGYRTTQAMGPTLGTITSTSFMHQQNLDGVAIARAMRLGTTGQFRNFWTAAVRAVYFPTVFDDREVGTGAALERKQRWGGEMDLGTDPRRRVVAQVQTGWQAMKGGTIWGFQGTLALRLLPQLDLDIGPDFDVRRGEPRHLGHDAGDGGTRYQVGDLAAESFGATLRMTWAFTPRLTLQTFTQVFLINKRYDNFQTVVDASDKPVLHLRDLSPAGGPGSDPSNRDSVINANVILRWEYLPGSTLFLVYSRTQRPGMDTLMGDMHDLRTWTNLTRGPAADVVLLKLAYFFG